MLMLGIGRSLTLPPVAGGATIGSRDRAPLYG
jgi:hypothetical protein